MLGKFRNAKQREIERLARLAEAGLISEPRRGNKPDFAKALNQPEKITIIAEYKRASPSCGNICKTLNVEDVARQYQTGGAGAMSVLTEEDFFDGKLEFLDRAAQATNFTLPLLRKDFIFHPLQVVETAATSASALLLIVRMFPDSQTLRDLREQTEKLGMQAVIEVFAENDLKIARAAGARIIQVNARDLDTLEVDRGACITLIESNPPEQNEIWIAASGMDSKEHLQAARNAGYSAALIGTALMRDGKPGETLAKITGKAS